MTLFDVANLIIGVAATAGAIIAARKMSSGRIDYRGRVLSPRVRAKTSTTATAEVCPEPELHSRAALFLKGEDAERVEVSHIFEKLVATDDLLKEMDNVELEGFLATQVNRILRSSMELDNTTTMELEDQPAADGSTVQAETIKRHERAIDDLEKRMRKLEEKSRKMTVRDFEGALPLRTSTTALN